jgi:hypothetical protein
MNKHCLRWKPYKDKTIRGSNYQSEFPDLLAISYKGLLITQILAMKRKEPIAFERAARMAQEKYFEAKDARRLGYAPGECFWYLDHFVEWISSLGYHIELTGDEFEPYQMSSKIQ